MKQSGEISPPSRRHFLKSAAKALAGFSVFPAIRVSASRTEDYVTHFRALGASVEEEDGKIISLSYNRCMGFDDLEYRAIGEFRSLKSLSLGGCDALTDAKVAYFNELTSLETLQLEGFRVSDAGMKHLAALPNLRKFNATHSGFDIPNYTGRGFYQFRNSAQLGTLSLDGIALVDEGFAALSRMPQIRRFKMVNNLVTKAGLENISSLGRLQHLTLGQRMFGQTALAGDDRTPSVSDATVRLLLKLRSLEYVELSHSRHTYEALAQLSDLTKLKTLVLHGVDIPPSHLAQLKLTLPNTRVDWSPMTPELRRKLGSYLDL